MKKMGKTEKEPALKETGKLDWQGASPPRAEVIDGRHARLLPLDAERDAPDLWRAYAADVEGKGWTWLPYGPFDEYEAFHAWLETLQKSGDPLFMVVVDREPARDGAIGLASWMRADAAMGSIEIGHIHFSPFLQRSRAGTEALYRMMQRVFEDWGYRRLEWKCDSHNQPSRRAAERLGFTFEGIFRQHLVVKGRNRDTAWYSIIDGEWPLLKAAFEAWLDPGNFDESGQQIQALAHLREGLQADGQRL